VEKITANHPFQLQEPQVPGEPPGVLAIESNITFVKADQAWSSGWTGQGTVLAGNDTGLDEDHLAIKSHYRGCLNPPTCTSEDHNYNWWDATDTYRTDPYDGHGHGTHTTGTMVGDDGGANRIGMAPGAKTVHCKNMTNGGSGSDLTFTECFQWDLAPWDLNGLNPRPDKAPDAITNSWGYWGGNQPQFEDELSALKAAGIVVEVSAGNEGPSCWSLRSPGDYRQSLTTGSVQHSGGVLPGTITGFSSRGPSDLYPADRDIPDVMAPGQSIRSSLPGNNYASWSGTSMAGPHVTGLVGLMWSANPGLRGRVAETIQIMTNTAVRLSGQTGSNCGGNYTVGPNNDWGYGTIDSLAASLATRSNTCTLDLVANTHNCYLVPAISFVVPLSGGKTVLKANLNAAQTGYNRAVFDTLYGGAPSGWTINIGDSATNNGFGGDGATQSNDSEMQIYGTTMSVYGSDPTPASVRNILNVYNAVSQGTTLSLDVQNQFLGWVKGDLRSNYIYALNGQADTEGPVNWDIFAGFNRSIFTSSRVGTGATRATVTLLYVPPPPGGGGGGSPVFEKQDPMETQ
jgi:subtilisin family serine protease